MELIHNYRKHYRKYYRRTTVNTTDQLVIDHMRLANSIAKKRKQRIPHCVTLEELRSAAYMGLVDASKRFDGQQTFATFAMPRIDGAITDYLRELRWGSRRSPVKAKEISHDIESRKTDEFNDLFDVVGKSIKSRTKNILKWHFVEGETQTKIAARLNVTRAYVNRSIKDFTEDMRSRWTQERLCG